MYLAGPPATVRASRRTRYIAWPRSELRSLLQRNPTMDLAMKSVLSEDLDRKLMEKRIFPAMDVTRSRTRREELLLLDDELQKVWLLIKVLSPLEVSEAATLLIEKLKKTKTNEDFLKLMQKM